MLFNCHGYFFGTKNTKVIPGVNYKFMQHLETRFNIDTTFSYIIKSLTIFKNQKLDIFVDKNSFNQQNWIH